MKIDNVKIVADSSADVLSLEKIPFSSAPLKIIADDKEFVDNGNLNVFEMVTFLQNYKGKSSTSCPNAGDWLEAFGDTKYVFCVTITGTLSGSYNSALLAKEYYSEMYPDRHVYVLNSLTAGPEIGLIIDKLQELILNGKDFNTICEEINEYRKKTGLAFMLESMQNLANNGRVSPIVAKMAGILGIRVVGKASERGDLEPLNKCRGEDKSLKAIIEHLISEGLDKGRVKIAHCFNETAAKKLATLLKERLKNVKTDIQPCRGLCSFYAEKGGILIGYEKF